MLGDLRLIVSKTSRASRAIFLRLPAFVPLNYSLKGRKAMYDMCATACHLQLQRHAFENAQILLRNLL